MYCTSCSYMYVGSCYCVSVSFMLHTFLSLYFQHNSCSVHAELQLLCTYSIHACVHEHIHVNLQCTGMHIQCTCRCTVNLQQHTYTPLTHYEKKHHQHTLACVMANTSHHRNWKKTYMHTSFPFYIVTWPLTI